MQPILFRSKDPRSWVLSRWSYSGMGCDIAIFDMHGSPWEQISEQKHEFWESGSPGRPGMCCTTTTRPRIRKETWETPHTKYEHHPSLELGHQNFLESEISEQNLGFSQISAPPTQLSKNWTCSPRTSMHSTNQVKLQTHSFSTVPVPLQNSQYFSRTVHLKF